MAEDEGPQIGYLALPRGVPVVTSDGVELGKVHRVLDNAREHIFDGIVVDTGNGKVFVDAPEVARIAERRVTLTFAFADMPSLPPHHGLRGSLEASAKRSAARWRRRFGGR
jgi:PRC-barrel domain